MNQRQANTHRMHRAVLELLDRHDAAWKTRPKVAEPVGALREAVGREVAISEERAGMATEGLTDEKAEARDAMEAAAMRLVLVARPFARATGDKGLLAEVDTTAAAFDRASDAKATERAGRILAAVEPRLGDLDGYGVAQKDADALRDAIAAFGVSGGVRDATDGQREARTGTLAGAFRDARKALKLLDDLVPGVLGDPTLTAEYRRVRRTDDR